jgi:hypothetical protein
MSEQPYLSDIAERLDLMEEHLAKAGRVPAPVQFGPKDHQTIPAAVASMVLTMWHQRQPTQFGAYLAEAYTGTRPTGRKTQT